MRGDGGVFQQATSRFYYCRYYLRGKKIVQSTGKTTEKEAEKFLRDKLKEVHADQIGAKQFVSPKQERNTVNDLLDNLKTDYTLRGKWGKKVESNIKPLRTQFGDWRAVDLTTEIISAYIAEKRAEGYSAATCNRWTQLLGQAFKLAVRTKQLAYVPFIPRLSEIGNERGGFFETEAFERVVENLPEYLQDFVRFDFLTGWRKGSLQSLRWSDVTEDTIVLRAENSKTRKPVSMPLAGDLKDIIERRQAAMLWEDEDGEAHCSVYVFHNQGQPIGEFRKTWASACVAAGAGRFVCRKCDSTVDEKRKCPKCKQTTWRQELKYVGALFHDFRRTAARNMVRGGTAVPVAMQITGHRTDAMFRRYAIVDEEQKREALLRTQAFLSARKKNPGSK